MISQKFNQPQRGFAHLALIVIVLAVASVAGYFGYTRLVKPKPTTPAPVNRNYKAVPKKSLPKAKPVTIRRRSKDPNTVQSLVVANATDKTGRPLSYSTVYKSNVPGLGLVLKLSPTKPGTNIDYVRYVNGKYLDHRHATTVTPNLQYLVFYWPLKGVAATRPKGDYLVKTYVNGLLDASTTYKVI